MGTRHLICIFYQGKWVIAQYGQWDGYPEGQGCKIFRFLCVAHNVEKLKAGLAHVYQPSDEELMAISQEIDDWRMDIHQRMRDMEREGGYIDPRANFPYPSLSRDTCAKLLGMIAGLGREEEEEDDNGDEVEGKDQHENSETTEEKQKKEKKKKKKLPIQLDLEFANDTLFCEWVYVIDLDAEVLEIYNDGEEKTEGHRFKDVGPPEAIVPRMYCSIPFTDIYLMSTEDEFLDRIKADVAKDEEEEEEGEEENEGAEGGEALEEKTTEEGLKETLRETRKGT